jgi:colanic acid/amylovoran biosynthesis glycosyltransferase
MTKVLYCTHTSVQVSETFLRKTRDYLATKFDILVLSTSQPGGEEKSLPSHFLGIRDESLFQRFTYNALSIIQKQAREEVRLRIHRRLVRQFFKRQNISASAAIVEYGTSAYVFAPVLIEKNIPFVITFHGYDCSMYLGFQWYRSEIVELCKSSIAVVVPSHHLRRRLQLIGVPEEKITIEPCAPYYEELPKSQPSTKPTVVALGRLTEKKCPEALVLTAHSVLKQFPQAHFHILGDGPQRPQVENLIRKLQLEDSVTLHGAVNHHAALQQLASATIFIQHSVTSSNGDQEGFPVAIAEALGMGVPVASTFHSGITEAIEHGVSGLLAQEHDFEEMAKHVNQLLADENLRLNMGAKGKDMITKIAGPLSREKKIASLIESAIAVNHSRAD